MVRHSACSRTVPPPTQKPAHFRSFLRVMVPRLVGSFPLASALYVLSVSCQTNPRTGRDSMQVTSEGPTKITKATIDAAWRRRYGRSSADRARQGLPRAGADRERDHDGMELRLSSARDRSADRTALAEQDSDARQPGLACRPMMREARRTGSRDRRRPVPIQRRRRRPRRRQQRRKRGNTLGRLVDDYERALPRRPKMRGAGLPSPGVCRRWRLRRSGWRLAAMDCSRHAGGRSRPSGRAGAAWLRRRRRHDCPRTVRRPLPLPGLVPGRRAHPGQPMRTDRPCAAAPGRRRLASHYLTPAELARLWHAAGGLREPVWRDLARFLIAVPCRRGEAARLEWSHLDLAAAEWRQPGHMTKNRDPHRLHLHALRLDVLRARHAGNRRQGLGVPGAGLGRVQWTHSPTSSAWRLDRDATGTDRLDLARLPPILRHPRWARPAFPRPWPMRC